MLEQLHDQLVEIDRHRVELVDEQRRTLLGEPAHQERIRCECVVEPVAGLGRPAPVFRGRQQDGRPYPEAKLDDIDRELRDIGRRRQRARRPTSWASKRSSGPSPPRAPRPTRPIVATDTRTAVKHRTSAARSTTTATVARAYRARARRAACPRRSRQRAAAPRCRPRDPQQVLDDQGAHDEQAADARQEPAEREHADAVSQPDVDSARSTSRSLRPGPRAAGGVRSTADWSAPDSRARGSRAASAAPCAPRRATPTDLPSRTRTRAAAGRRRITPPVRC